MFGLLRSVKPRPGKRLAIAMVAIAALGLLSGLAAAAFTVSSLDVTKVAVGGKSLTIVVDNRSVTVYELGGESLKHLQCVSRACFDVWPPVEVRSAGSLPRKASGVPGTVSTLRRVRGGFYQVMLDRHPLYYYAGDSGRKRSAKGDGITSFGGRWHVVKAAGQG
jgi:predicted lipoprotein with Yx(FWY)xxD motif